MSLYDICLFQVANDVKASYDVLVDLFHLIENFLERLKVYAEVPQTPMMTEIVVKIMIELLSVLALATKQIRDGKISESVLSDVNFGLIHHREIRGKAVWG